MHEAPDTSMVEVESPKAKDDILRISPKIEYSCLLLLQKNTAIDTFQGGLNISCINCRNPQGRHQLTLPVSSLIKETRLKRFRCAPSSGSGEFRSRPLPVKNRPSERLLDRPTSRPGGVDVNQEVPEEFFFLFGRLFGTWEC